MQELPLLLIFWYGILHAFGPDHLTAITDFSIGKSKQRTMLITFAFAIGHGVSLFLFAKLLEHIDISENVLAWGDYLSSGVIIAIGLFLLFMALTGRINVGWHEHEGKRHIHIWYGKNHEHRGDNRVASALTMGTLMGIGGVRGMLVTLSAIAHHEVSVLMVASFTVGVMAVFLLFGYLISLVNENILQTERRVRLAFATAGTISLIVGANMFM